MKQPTIVVEPDTRPEVPDQIESYVHCATCDRFRPPSISPSDWARLSIGFQADGTPQVVCARCRLNVMTLKISLAWGE